MGELHIFCGREITVHPALQRVAHGVNLVSPRASSTHQFRIISAIVGALDGEACIGSMLPNQAPVIHNFVVQRLGSVGACSDWLCRKHIEHHGTRDAYYCVF